MISPRCKILTTQRLEDQPRATKKLRLIAQATKERRMMASLYWFHFLGGKVPQKGDRILSGCRREIEASHEELRWIRRRLKNGSRLSNEYSRPWHGTSGWAAGGDTRLNRKLQRAWNKRMTAKIIKWELS